MREILKDGKPTTQFLEDGDRVRIEMRDADGKNLFGTIDQKVARA
jgi:fumarylacetoacetate (FAA) hydrolase